MPNPIPMPRRSDGERTLPRRNALIGPSCPRCDHASCRDRRAQRLPLLGGHRTEFAREHAQAAAIQARHRHLVIWWGEATQSFWVAAPTGLHEAADVDALLLLLWPHSDRFARPEPGTPVLSLTWQGADA
ncbi:hypothetical protein [Nocardiopsis aegyptia]|uniref:Uncharacterized protein n=1 Tax=Nocardiopsis aegyptia TaxID=220378 RepID=A0A7Z0EKR1_9ACTN|nr:hypothetical protein [Nocardiopsis aegyptia]NYJ33854.1 hypothetical protein [Nocardiopsis aegyptia]